MNCRNPLAMQAWMQAQGLQKNPLGLVICGLICAHSFITHWRDFCGRFFFPRCEHPHLAAFSIQGERKSHPLTWPLFRILLVTNIAHTWISEISVNLNTHLHFEVSLNQIDHVHSIHPHHQALDQAKIIPDKIKSFAAFGDTALKPATLPIYHCTQLSIYI